MPEVSKIKAVIADVDETLVHEDNETHRITISQNVLAALTELEEDGIICAPATGRNFFRRKWITRILGFNTYGVFQGGASIVDLQREETIWERRLSPDIARPLTLQILNEVEPRYLNIGKGRMPAQAVNIDDIDSNCVGIWAEIPRLHLPRFNEIIAATPDVHYHDNGGNFGADVAALHITHKEADKGATTLRALGLLGIQPGEAVVIGDSDNDRPLFEIEGLHLRIAIQNENTPESLLRAADVRVGSIYEDGFAEAMRTYVLK